MDVRQHGLQQMADEIHRLLTEIDKLAADHPDRAWLQQRVLQKEAALQQSETLLQQERVAQAQKELLLLQQQLGTVVGNHPTTSLPVSIRCVQRFHRHLGAEPSILDPEEVEYLIKSGESSVVDFKEVRLSADASSKQKFLWSNRDIAVAACGFANSAMGGVMLCGINDKTREVTGVPAEAMEDFKHHVSQALRTCASPPIRHALSSVQVANSSSELAWVVAIDITPGRQLTEAGDPRAVYQRHGDENVKKIGVALQDLQQGWSTVRGLLDAGDVMPVPGATLDNFLDKTKLERLNLGWLADSPSLPVQLMHMRLAAHMGTQVVLTVAGLLLLSKVENWQRMVGCPSYCIQVQVFNNDDPPGTYVNQYSTDIYSSMEVLGDALFQVDRTSELIHALTLEQYQKRVVTGADGRQVVRGLQHALYPAKAVEELVVNAIVHRTYRENTGKIVIKVRHRSLEILVPGDFLPGISAANIGTLSMCSMPRNPVLSSFMHDIHRLSHPGKIFEGHGLGVMRARQAIEAAGGSLKYRSEPTGAVTVMITAAPSPYNSP